MFGRAAIARRHRRQWIVQPCSRARRISVPAHKKLDVVGMGEQGQGHGADMDSARQGNEEGGRNRAALGILSARIDQLTSARRRHCGGHQAQTGVGRTGVFLTRPSFSRTLILTSSVIHGVPSGAKPSSGPGNGNGAIDLSCGLESRYGPDPWIRTLAFDFVGQYAHVASKLKWIAQRPDPGVRNEVVEPQRGFAKFDAAARPAPTST